MKSPFWPQLGSLPPLAPSIPPTPTPYWLEGRLCAVKQGTVGRAPLLNAQRLLPIHGHVIVRACAADSNVMADQQYSTQPPFIYLLQDTYELEVRVVVRAKNF
jgi:hypothetical protein